MARFAQKTTTDFEATDNYEHGYAFPTSNYSHITKPGISEEVVREISSLKK
jgi:hypothetical protein